MKTYRYLHRMKEKLRRQWKDCFSRKRVFGFVQFEKGEINIHTWTPRNEEHLMSVFKSGNLTTLASKNKLIDEESNFIHKCVRGLLCRHITT